MKTFAAALLSLALIHEPQATYLGSLDGNPFSPDSTENPFSVYGNEFDPDSLKNEFGEWGNPLSGSSPKNPFSTDTPQIWGVDVQRR